MLKKTRTTLTSLRDAVMEVLSTLKMSYITYSLANSVNIKNAMIFNIMNNIFNTYDIESYNYDYDRLRNHETHRKQRILRIKKNRNNIFSSS